jgi:hypothetical protein
MRVIFSLLLLFLGTALSQPLLKKDWTNVASAPFGSSDPRVASFSNGDFIIVYEIGGLQGVAAQIFDAYGNRKNFDQSLDILLQAGNYSAPNVLVFTDDQ